VSNRLSAGIRSEFSKSCAAAYRSHSTIASQRVLHSSSWVVPLPRFHRRYFSKYVSALQGGYSSYFFLDNWMQLFPPKYQRARLNSVVRAPLPLKLCPPSGRIPTISIMQTNRRISQEFGDSCKKCWSGRRRGPRFLCSALIQTGTDLGRSLRRCWSRHRSPISTVTVYYVYTLQREKRRRSYAGLLLVRPRRAARKPSLPTSTFLARYKPTLLMDEPKSLAHPGPGMKSEPDRGT
jgi:hypothetical protein